MKKTECSKGHAMTFENTYVTDVKYFDKRTNKTYLYTRYICRQCRIQQKRNKTARLRAERVAQAEAATACNRGHPFAEYSTFYRRKTIRKDGTEFYKVHRICRACRRIARLTFKERHGLRPEPRFYATHCCNGHLMRGDNVSVMKQWNTRPDGIRVPYKVRRCLACRREQHIARQAKRGHIVIRRLEKYASQER